MTKMLKIRTATARRCVPPTRARVANRRAFGLARREVPRVACSPAVAEATGSGQEGGGVAKKGILLTKAEVPAFIGRPDLMNQMYQWAEVEIGQQSRTQFGYSMGVERITGVDSDGDDFTVGFRVTIGTETTLDIAMDGEITEKYEFLAKGKDGFPVPKGKKEEVYGKYLEIRKVDSNPVSEEAKQAIKELAGGIMKAFDKYYAFGSVFSDDST